MIMYYYENNNDNKFIFMWFIDVSHNVQGNEDDRKDSDEMIHLHYLMILVNHFSYFKILKTA